MAFDAGPRAEPPSPRPLRDEVTWQDRLDAVLRAVVIVPLMGLYTWWVIETIRPALVALFAG